jgi:hypothetical protein
MVLKLFSITLLKGILSCNKKTIKIRCSHYRRGAFVTKREAKSFSGCGTHGFLEKLATVWLIIVEGLPIAAWHIKIGQEGICNLCTKSSLETTKHGLM